MYKCKILYSYRYELLENKLNDWFEKMRDTPMMQLNVQYAETPSIASVLITWFEIEEGEL